MSRRSWLPDLSKAACLKHLETTVRILLRTFFLAILLATTASAAENWTQFRGPSGDGFSSAANVPLHWSGTNNIVWKVSIPGRGRSSPVILGDRIWVTTALERGTKRTLIGPDDMQTAEHVTLNAACLERAKGNTVWETTLFEVVEPDPVHWMSDDGMLTCANSQSAEIHWQERLGGLHSASPLSAEGRVYVFAQDGRATVIKAGKEFEKLAENQLEGPLVATPAFVDGTVFIRTDNFLFRIGEK